MPIVASYINRHGELRILASVGICLNFGGSKEVGRVSLEQQLMADALASKPGTLQSRGRPICARSTGPLDS